MSTDRQHFYCQVLGVHLSGRELSTKGRFIRIRGFMSITTHLQRQTWTKTVPHNLGRNLLLLQVGELLLQGGHLIQTLHPPPLTVLVVHLCSRTHMTDLTSTSAASFLPQNSTLHVRPPWTNGPRIFKSNCIIKMNSTVTEKNIYCARMWAGMSGLFFLPELSPSSDTEELTVSSSSVLLPSCSGKSTSISSWLLSFFSRE